MHKLVHITQQARFYGGLVLLYGGLIGYGWIALQAHSLIAAPPTLPAIQPPAVPIPAMPQPAPITGTPVSLSIPSLNLKLPIQTGTYNTATDSWTISEAEAFFASPSVQPNDQAGNTLIYGHNNNLVFKQLHNITTGTTLVIDTAEGHQFTYEYVKQTIVEPTDVSIFGYVGEPIVTLQTCTGNWNEKRALFSFELTDVKQDSI
jgi:LPXTG-site transpeptidase (sortase) family protein